MNVPERFCLRRHAGKNLSVSTGEERKGKMYLKGDGAKCGQGLESGVKRLKRELSGN
jgi:hypothetical protein